MAVFSLKEMSPSFKEIIVQNLKKYHEVKESMEDVHQNVNHGSHVLEVRAIKLIKPTDLRS